VLRRAEECAENVPKSDPRNDLLITAWWAQLPLLTDPFFYAVAVPAVLLVGLSKSGFASGFGSLATPMMALIIPVPQAAAILLPLLIVMDAATLQQLWPHRDRLLVRRIIPWGIAGTAVGWAMFGILSAPAVAGLTGALTLAFLAQRLLFPPKQDAPPAHRWVGSACATVSGFTSFVAHAGGPPLAAYMLPQKLPPPSPTAAPWRSSSAPSTWRSGCRSRRWV